MKRLRSALLRGQLRQQGVEKPEQVKRACLEANGLISVVKKERAADGAQRKSKKPV